MNRTTESRPAGACAVLAAVFAISGCSIIPRHELDISRGFRENPVNSVCIAGLFMAENVDRVWPEDFAEMLAENRDRSLAEIGKLAESSISTSITADSACASDEKIRAWARGISDSLIVERVPLSVPAFENGPQSVLIISVMRYGIEKDQLHVRFLPFLPWTRKHYVGDPKYDHICDLSALLARPKDGAVLFTVREQQVISSSKPDRELLALAAKNAAAVVGGAFTPKKEE